MVLKMLKPVKNAVNLLPVTLPFEHIIKVTPLLLKLRTTDKALILKKCAKLLSAKALSVQMKQKRLLTEKQ